MCPSYARVLLVAQSARYAVHFLQYLVTQQSVLAYMIKSSNNYTPSIIIPPDNTSNECSAPSVRCKRRSYLLFLSSALACISAGLERHAMNSDGGTASEFGLGKATLAWEQFTTFWVEAAMINTHSEASAVLWYYSGRPVEILLVRCIL